MKRGCADGNPEPCGDLVVGQRLMKKHRLHQRITLRALLRHDVEKVEQQALAVVRGHVGAFALLTNQNAVLDQLVNGFAQRANRDAVFHRQLPLGRNQLAGLQVTGGQLLHQRALHAFIERSAVEAIHF